MSPELTGAESFSQASLKGIKTIRVYENPKSNKWAMGFVSAVRFA